MDEFAPGLDEYDQRLTEIQERYERRRSESEDRYEQRTKEIARRFRRSMIVSLVLWAIGIGAIGFVTLAVMGRF